MGDIGDSFGPQHDLLDQVVRGSRRPASSLRCGAIPDSDTPRSKHTEIQTHRDRHTGNDPPPDILGNLTKRWKTRGLNQGTGDLSSQLASTDA